VRCADRVGDDCFAIYIYIYISIYTISLIQSGERRRGGRTDETHVGDGEVYTGEEFFQKKRDWG
jgi:hypothetical protein